MTPCRSCYDSTTIGEFVFPREVVGELLYERQFLRMNEFELYRAIERIHHNVVQTIKGEKYRWATFGCDLRPECEVDRPCYVWVLGAELTETKEGDVGLDRDGEVVLLGYLERVKEGVVGFGDLGE